MSEAAPGYRDATGFATPQRRRLAEATRHLIDAVLTTEDAAPADLDAAAARVEALVETLTGVPAGQHPAGVRERAERAGLDYLPRSPVVGETSPFAPPFEWTVDGGRARATATLGAPYEGPPGYVHGGMIALIFDEVLGMANISNGTPGMTGTLKVRYRKPTPLRRPVEVEGWVERVEGRRIIVQGTLTVEGVVTAEAEGVFVSLIPRLAQAYFGREPEGGAAPEPGGNAAGPAGPQAPRGA
jgi:acyl-coenzyme A thioesterase PaaI-like protein